MKKILTPFLTLILFISICAMTRVVYADLTTNSNSVSTRVGNPVVGSGNHVCPLQANFINWPGAYTSIGSGQMSWVCEHCHDQNTFRSIDMGVTPAGGTPEVAITDGVATKLTPGAGTSGRSIVLDGDDGYMYFYAHLKDWNIPNGSTRVKAGDVIGYVAAAADTASANNGVAHLHIQTTTNGDNYHPNTFIGPLLDQWCKVDVCHGTQTACGH